MTRLTIIVRFRNEAVHLEAVLRAVREQRCDHQVEIVAIDNSSTDNSRIIAARYADLVLDISEYQPGAALNQAIGSCTGDGVVILSAHAIPANMSWLENLTAWLPNPEVLGTYGAQLYPITSRFLDKRDLDIFSGLRPRTEVCDSDFDVRWRVAGALGRIGTPLAARFLVQGLRDRSFYPRDESAWALARLGVVGAAELLPVLGELDAETLPFAALALGLSGDDTAAHRAVEILADGLASSNTPVVRDSLYFLGEIARVPAAAGLTSAVAAYFCSQDDEVARAAAWCWGMLAAAGYAGNDLDQHELVNLARRHLVETTRFEAGLILGKASTARQFDPIGREGAPALPEHWSGRVRY